jgi:hypothetical protein
MSDENRSEETGQFTPSTEGAVGEEHANLRAGYVPFEEEPKPEAVESDDPSRDLADKFSEARGTPEADIQTYSETFNNLPDNASLTTGQLGKLFSEHRESGEKQIEAAEIEATRKEVDELRGVDPDAAPEAEAKTAEPESEDAAIEKALKIPKLKAALTEVNERFTQSVNTANAFAQAAFIESFPEIASMPLEQWEGALTAMAQHEPDRFTRAMATLHRVTQLQTAQQQQRQRAEQQRQAELTEYAKAESLKFEQTIKNVPKAERAEIEQNIAEAITEHGGDLSEIVQLMQRSEFASATVQNLLWELGTLRKFHKGVTAAKLAAPTRTAPQVQRPGVAGPRMSHGESSVAAAKDAVDRDRSNKSLGNLISALRRAG